MATTQVTHRANPNAARATTWSHGPQLAVHRQTGVYQGGVDLLADDPLAADQAKRREADGGELARAEPVFGPVWHGLDGRPDIQPIRPSSSEPAGPRRMKLSKELESPRLQSL